MQAIEFEATTFQHTIRVPDSVPDGVSVRIVLSFDDTKSDAQDNNVEPLGLSMPKESHDEDFTGTRQANKFSPFPTKLTVSRDEINDRRPEYLTMEVTEIDIPTRDERYDR